MINPCTCTKRGGSSSSTKKQTKSKISKKNCTKNPSIPSKESKTMLSSNNNSLDLPRTIVPCVSWKTAKRAVRRARTSFTGDNNRAKIATNSNSNGSGDNNNNTDEEFRGTDQAPVSESEKFGVTILGRRFSDDIQNVPIKKRKCLLVSSPASVYVYETSLNAGSNCGVESLQDFNQADFSGISILADVACKTEFPTPERSKTGTINEETTAIIPAQKAENENGDGLDKDCRLKWDLNTVMETWEFDEQGGIVNENVNCKDTKEALGSICDEEMKDVIKCEEEAELKEKLDLKEKEGEIISQAEPPKESIVGQDEKESILGDGQAEPSRESIVEESNVVQIELNEKEIKDEEESNVGQVEVKESTMEVSNVVQIKLNEKESENEEGEITQAESSKESIVEECNVNQVDLNCEIESNSLNHPAVGIDSNEDFEPNDSSILSLMGPTNEEPEQPVSEQNDDVQINLNDSGPIRSMDDKTSPDFMQLNPSVLNNETNLDSTQLNPSISGTVIEAEIENGDTKGAEFYMEKENENVGDNNSEVSKDLNEKIEREVEEEEEYQYEDGELREELPIIDYWSNNDNKNNPSEELSKTEHEAHESDKQEINHRDNLIEPIQNESLESELPLPPPPISETNNNNNNNNMQFEEIRDDWDTEMVEIRDDWDNEPNEKREFLESEDLDERPRRNKRTGWDRLPESSNKNFNRDLSEKRRGESYFRRDPSSPSRRSFDRNHHKSFVRPRRSYEEDEIPDSQPNNMRLLERNPRPQLRRGDQNPKIRARPGPTYHRSPPHHHHEFPAPSFAPSNSKNATAASIAKVKSNGFVVAPDGTLVKRRESLCLSRERELSPIERFHHHHHQRPVRVRVTDICSRRGGKVDHFNLVHHHHLSPPVHVVSRSRTRSPNAWGSRMDRARSPACRAGYTSHVLPRWVDDRPCLRGSPVMPHHHHYPVGRCSGYEMRGGPHRHEYDRNFNNGFNRARDNNNSNSKMVFERRGVDFDRRRGNKEERDGRFKFARGRGRRSNVGFSKRYDDIRDSHVDNGDSSL